MNTARHVVAGKNNGNKNLVAGWTGINFAGECCVFGQHFQLARGYLTIFSNPVAHPDGQLERDSCGTRSGRFGQEEHRAQPDDKNYFNRKQAFRNHTKLSFAAVTGFASFDPTFSNFPNRTMAPIANGNER